MLDLKAYAFPTQASFDEARYRSMAARHSPIVKSKLRQYGVSHLDLEDALQETLLVMSAKLNDITKGCERAFLVATAIGIAANARRSRRRRSKLHSAYASGTDELLVLDLERKLDEDRMYDRAATSLQALPAELREVLLLHELDELNIFEVADQLQLSQGTAASRVRRAREAFERQMKHSVRIKAPNGQNLQPELAVFHWWSTRSETGALDAVLGMHALRHPRHSVIGTNVGGVGSAKRQLDTRMLWGKPPSIFQVSAGRDMSDWVRINGRDDADSQLRPLNELCNVEEWIAQFPQEIARMVSVGKRCYAVPVNIHRTNTLFYCSEVLEHCGVRAPSSLQDFLTTAAELQRRGVVALALGLRDPWPLTVLAFENLMISIAGHQYYEAFFRGQKSASDKELRDTLESLKQVLGFATPHATALTWNEAVDTMLLGEAAMTIMGDWVRGYLLERGASFCRGVPNRSKKEVNAHRTFGQVATFGTSEVFVFSSDAFALPKQAEHSQAAGALLETLASKDGQREFNLRKGSIAARNDANLPGRYRPAQGTAIAEFGKLVRVPSLSALAPRQFTAVLDKAMGAFAVTRNVEDVIRVIKTHYRTLR